MSKYNCPNCGAPIEGVKCPYCGTILLDFADLSADKPAFVRIKAHGTVVMVKAIINELSFKTEPEYQDLYADNRLFASYRCPENHTIDMQLRVLEDNDGILARMKRLSE